MDNRSVLKFADNGPQRDVRRCFSFRLRSGLFLAHFPPIVGLFCMDNRSVLTFADNGRTFCPRSDKRCHFFFLVCPPLNNTNPQKKQARALHLPMGQSSDHAHLRNERISVHNLIRGQKVIVFQSKIGGGRI